MQDETRAPILERTDSPGEERRVRAPRLAGELRRQIDRIEGCVSSEVGAAGGGTILLAFFSVGEREDADRLAYAFAVRQAALGRRAAHLRSFLSLPSLPDEAEPDPVVPAGEAGWAESRSRRIDTTGVPVAVVEARSPAELVRSVVSARETFSDRSFVVVAAGSIEREPACARVLRHCDASVLVTRFGSLRWESGEAALRELRESGVRVAGAVMTGCPLGADP